MYKCKICGKEFEKPQSLAGHVKGHGVRKIKNPPQKGKFKCDICNKEFPTSHGVIVHKAQVHQIYGKYYQKYGHLPGKVAEMQGPPSVLTLSKELLNPGEVAAELLTRVVDIINKNRSYQNEIARLKEENLELEGTVKKEREEKERILRAYNDLVKQGGMTRDRFPSISSILTAREKK